MNKNLNEALFDIGKVDALMYAFEHTYLDIETVPEEYERADAGVNAFYAIWDAVKKLKEDIERLVGDDQVVDAIYAVNDVNRRK